MQGGGVDAKQAQDHSLDQVKEGVGVLLLGALRRPAPKQPRLLQVVSQFLHCCDSVSEIQYSEKAGI